MCEIFMSTLKWNFNRCKWVFSCLMISFNGNLLLLGNFNEKLYKNWVVLRILIIFIFFCKFFWYWKIQKTVKTHKNKVSTVFCRLQEMVLPSLPFYIWCRCQKMINKYSIFTMRFTIFWTVCCTIQQFLYWPKILWLFS